MEALKQVYERIRFLRDNGIKMKDIAARTGFSPSVLSALYSTVIPEYEKNLQQGEDQEEALDHALILVNNISRKKLMASLPSLLSTLATMDVPALPHKGYFGNPFLSAIGQGMAAAVKGIEPFCGTYLSYSISSNGKKLKIEPYLLAMADNGLYAEAYHNNAYGAPHQGAVLMNGAIHIYICFNEFQDPQLSLFYICLKIPMYDRPPFLRGLYLCLDYNRNPIARRILFVRQSSSTDRESFRKMQGFMKEFDQLDEDERKIYDYTCTEADSIRLCNIPSPQMDYGDLQQEKAILKGNLK